MANVNLLALYQRTFGYVATPFSKSGIAAVVPVGSAFANEDLQAAPPKEFNSVFGSPIFMPVQIEIPGLKWKLPNEPVVTINQVRRIVETEIDSADGSFKELFSNGDFDIKIEGIIADEDFTTDQYPADEVRKLRQIVEYKGSCKIYCDMLSLWNITQIAIYSFDLPAVPGSPSSTGYVITAKSDKNYDLEVKS